MAKALHEQLSRRERQIMDIIYRFGQATAAEVRDHLPEPPSYSAVRAMLRILEEKGHLRHQQEGPRYIYRATVPHEKAQHTALHRVLDTFFDGSVSKAMAALLDMSEDLPAAELDRLSQLIEKARKEGR